MIVISTYGNQPVTRSDMLQLQQMFAGLCILYKQHLVDLETRDKRDNYELVEEMAHEARTSALRLSAILDIPIDKAQNYINLGYYDYVR